jgi:hypothetical protein
MREREIIRAGGRRDAAAREEDGEDLPLRCGESRRQRRSWQWRLSLGAGGACRSRRRRYLVGVEEGGAPGQQRLCPGGG